MTEYIERDAAIAALIEFRDDQTVDKYGTVRHCLVARDAIERSIKLLESLPAADVEPVVHGRWILEAHDERANYRWNVTAECSECCDEQKEIWAGFFPNVPPTIARDVALVSAESVKLSNYCPNCGAKMDGGSD